VFSETYMTGRLLVGADLRAARGEWRCKPQTDWLGDPALPKPNIIEDYERSSITPISNFGDDSGEDQAKSIGGPG